MKKTLLALLLLSLFGTFAVQPGATAAPQPEGQTQTAISAAKNKPCITANEYRKVTRGMKLNRVAKIVGSRGSIMYGDIHLHARRWVSCVAVDDERMPVCMLFRRKLKSDGSFGVARMRNKNLDC